LSHGGEGVTTHQTDQKLVPMQTFLAKLSNKEIYKKKWLLG
jgi:hypothetical protein